MTNIEASSEGGSDGESTQVVVSEGTGCTPGTLGCACDGGACVDGLVCDAQICVDPPNPSQGTTQEPPDSSSSSAGDDTTTDASSSDATTSSEPECTKVDDNVNAACVEADSSRPFCTDAGACIGCLDDAQCDAGTGGLRPVCLDAGDKAGACVECDTANPVDAGQCSEGQSHCNLDTYECEGCLEHSECAETACDVAMRSCFSNDRIVYVRRGPTPNSPCTYEVPTGGYPAKPYCAMQPAIEHAQYDGLSSGWLFVIMSGDSDDEMPAFTIPDGDVPVNYAIKHTPGAILDMHTRFSDLGPIITVGSKVTLYLIDMGVHVLENAFDDVHVGIDCRAGGSIWLDDSRILRAVGPGIRADHCEVRLRRSSIAFGKTEGIEMLGGSLHVLNSFVDENRSKPGLGGGAISLGDSAVAEIVYSTLAKNKNVPISGRGDTVDCNGPATVKVRNSILAREPGTGNPSIVCDGSEVLVTDSVVDGEFDNDLNNNHKKAPEDILGGLELDGLTGAYLIMAVEKSLIFKNMAVWITGDPHDDYDRQARNAVMGMPDYAGADYYVP